MKRISWLVALSIVWLSAASVHAADISFDFGSVGNSTIQFNGATDTFTFSSSTLADVTNGWSFQINNVHNGTGSAVGLYGKIIGTFKVVGPVVTTPTTLDLPPAGPSPNDLTLVHEYAQVQNVGSAQLIIGSPDGNFTADLTFNFIESYEYYDSNGRPIGQTGYINSGAVVNLSNLTYNGTNPDLIKLASYLHGRLSPTFQFHFNGVFSLSNLLNSQANYTTSYSGSLIGINPVPVPASALLFGLGGTLAGGFGLLRRRILKS